MADFAQLSQDYSLVTITTSSYESIGTWINTFNNIPPASAVWPAANEAIYIPFSVPVPFLAARMFIYNGGTVNGNVDLGIYDVDGNTIITKGATAQAGTSALQFLDITDTTLNPGVYYMGVSMDLSGAGTATAISWAPNNLTIARASGILSQSTASPLPTSTATFAAAQHAYIPVVGVSSRTV